MSTRDFRCLVSGVSLLGAEAAAWLFVREEGGRALPITLPIWGCYGGHGRLEDVSDGPHTKLLEQAFVRGGEQGSVRVSWERLGLSPGAIDHVEGIVSLALMASIHGELDAFLWHDQAVHCALFEANVAAALMQGEPRRLHSAKVHELGSLVLPHRISRDIYGPVADATATERCKFGLGFVSCAALIDALVGLRIEVRGPGSGIALAERREQEWLAAALQRFSENEVLLLALSEYASRDAEG